MKVWVISDTHGDHSKLTPPDVDMVIHAGDESNSIKTHPNLIEASTFLTWFADLPIKHKVFVAGNHSTVIYRKQIDPRNYGITYLEHESTEIEGFKIFGSPMSPAFGDWSFMYKRHKGNKIWQDIPTDTDILVTHSPPWGILDICLDMDAKTHAVKQVGCKNLRKQVLTIKPKYHIFGHIHDEKTYENYGILKQNDITFINAAVYSHRHPKWVHPGHIIEIGE